VDDLELQERLRWRRQARRDVARRHHPDVGGNPEVYRELMHRLDHGVDETGQDGDLAHRVPLARKARRLVWRTRRRLRRHARVASGRLPRRIPGARRYIDL